jgi:predicted  nucleic acid-binding Zn-ribbon protein
MLHADSELQQLTIADLQNRLDQEQRAALDFQQQFAQASKEMAKLSSQSTRNQASISTLQQENSAIRNEFENLRKEMRQQQHDEYSASQAEFNTVRQPVEP